ncbi:MAG: hypothetical protein V3V86_08330 [Gammaproteobacteria bacterium]
MAEKFRHCLEAMHGVFREIGSNSKGGAEASAAGYDSLRFQARYAFHSALVGYLALNNMLALANEFDISDRLLDYGREEFAEWLDRINPEGSLTG